MTVCVKLQEQAARINRGGLLVSSSHIFVESGKFLQTTAFGGYSLKLVVSFPFLDIVLLKGPEGPAFRLLLDGLCPGLPVMMLGLPEAPRADLEAPRAELEGLSTPVAAKGQ
ncbi:hypothetical protein ABBQ38_011873 [Trebouxia sp. C0009 RCD-2024]